MFDEIMKKTPRAMRDFSTDDVLAALGLQRQPSVIESALPSTLAFVAGVAAGAGIALLLAPKSGREMRSDITNKASEMTNRLTSAASEAVESVRNAAMPSDNDRSRTEPQRVPSGANRSTS